MTSAGSWNRLPGPGRGVRFEPGLISEHPRFERAQTERVHLPTLELLCDLRDRDFGT